MEEEIHVVNKISEIFRRQATERTSRLAQSRNALIPSIHRLPDEVLSHTIQLSLIRSYPTGIFVDGRPWLARQKDLQLVSHRWHQIVLHTPQFWSLIFSTFGSAAAQAYLKRSKHAPLEIFAYSTYDNYAAGVPDILQPHLHRCRLLFFVLSYSEYDSFLSLPLPLLERVILSSPDHLIFVSPYTLAEAPRLVRLDLDNILIPHEGATLDTLKELRITLDRVGDDRNDPLMLWQLLVQLLGRCPRLEALSLSLSGLHVDAGDASQHPTIHFPYLRSLDTALPVNLLEFLYSTFDAPRCTQVRVYKALYDTLPTAVETPLLKSLLPSFRGEVQFSISQESEGGGVLDFNADTKMISIGVPAGQGRTGAVIIAYYLRHINPKISSSSLDLNLGQTDAMMVVHLLCHPVIPVTLNEAPFWPFPHLTHLRLAYNVVPMILLVYMVRSRRDRVDAEKEILMEEDVASYPGPKPLENITVVDYDAENGYRNILSDDWYVPAPQICLWHPLM